MSCEFSTKVSDSNDLQNRTTFDLENQNRANGNAVSCIVLPLLAMAIAIPASLFTYACYGGDTQVFNGDPCILAVVFWAMSMISLCCCVAVFVCRSCD